MALFIKQDKPKDFDCGYNLDLMIAALPRIKNQKERNDYVERIISLIKQSHKNWVFDNGDSPQAWEHFFDLADYNPNDYGIYNPYKR